MFIYFLIKNEAVIYVGRTKDLKRRISEHKNKDYDYYFYTECDQEYAGLMEDRYITLFDPPLNHSLNSVGEYKNLVSFCEENNMDINAAREIYKSTPYIMPVFNENFHPYILNSLKALYESERAR